MMIAGLSMVRRRTVRKLKDSVNTVAEMSLAATSLAMAPATAWLVLRLTGPRADRRYAWLNGMTMSRKKRTAATMAPVGSRRRTTGYGMIAARKTTTKLSLPPATA